MESGIVIIIERNIFLMQKKYNLLLFSVLLAGSLILFCGVAGTAHAAQQIPTSVVSGLESGPDAPDTCRILLSNSGSQCSGEGVSISGSTITIFAEGEYILSGNLSPGQIRIEAPEDAKVRLVLNGVSLMKEGDAAIYAITGDKLVISSMEGSVNLIASTGEFSTGSNVDGAIFSRCDLTFSGDGVLNVSCATKHGIVSKDDLKIKSGTIYVESGGKALCGKDSVTVEGGSISTDCRGDAISTTNTEASSKGNIIVHAGSLNLLTRKEGLDAAGDILIEDGSVVISAGDSNILTGKGIVSGGSIIIRNGQIRVNAVDDTIHARDVTVSGGSLMLKSGDDGIHADNCLTVNAGSVDISESYEGLEADSILIAGGDIRITAQDDGLNAAGGNDRSNAYGLFGGDLFSETSTSALTISGGNLLVDSMGDGLDSNGDLVVTGGVTYITGPASNGNGALDYGKSACISGGTVIASGDAAMAANFGNASTQGSILLTFFSSQAAGSTISIADENGHELASFQPSRPYNSVVISTEGMVQNGTYTITAGNEVRTVVLDTLIYGNGRGVGGPGFGGPRGQSGPGLDGPDDPPPLGFGGPDFRADSGFNKSDSQPDPGYGSPGAGNPPD